MAVGETRRPMTDLDLPSDQAGASHAGLKRLARFGTVGFGAFSRVFALGSQFVVLLLLGRLLPKTDFGDFMVAFALSRVLSQGIGTGLATLLVYHVSRNAGAERTHALHRSTALLGFAVAGAAAVLLVVAAPAISAAFGKPSLAFWVAGLAPFMLFGTLLTLGTGVTDGLGQISRSIALSELVPNIIRLFALPTLLFLGWGNHGVLVVMAASVLVPWLVFATMLFRLPAGGWARLTRWDLAYSGRLTMHSFAAMQMQGIDMLVAGWLFTSGQAADYAIASRVAALIPFFQQIVVKGFMAHAGKAIHEGDLARLQARVDGSRRTCVMLVGLTAAGAMAVYPALLHFLGGFGGSMPLLALLAAGTLFRSYFPGLDALVRIAGHAKYSLRIMLASVGLLLVLSPLLAPLFGPLAVAISMLVSAVTLNPLLARYIRRLFAIDLGTREMAVPMAIATLGIVVALSPGLCSWYAGTLLLGASVISARLYASKRWVA